MTQSFNALSEKEYDDLKNAFAEVTVLIAGADGDISDDELSWAEKVADIRSYNLKGDIKEFYVDLHTDLHKRILDTIQSASRVTEERKQQLSEKLSGINAILAKLDPAIGAHIYKGLVSLAEHTAKADGGILGFFNINKEEGKLIGLPMLMPIAMPEGSEEE